MGFTSTSGLLMSIGTGNLDPVLAWYLMKVEELTPEKFNQLINHERGLLGISATSSDLKERINYKYTDPCSAEAFKLFCYQAKKFIGAYTTALERWNTLVFSGGIG